MLFAAHPGALGLQEALRAYDDESHASWAKTIRSPKLMMGRIKSVVRQLRRPTSWPIAVKMTNQDGNVLASGKVDVELPRSRRDIVPV